MPENSSKIVVIVILALWLVVLVRLIVKALKNKYAPVKTVQAIVIDKHKIETFSKYSGNGKHNRFVVVFLADSKKLSFYVSEFSYGGYRLHESGSLKYKGDKIIQFQ